MLVLVRKAEQSIMIGDEIEVFVAAVMDGGVRIGIKAPRSVPIVREELDAEPQPDHGTQDAE
jgi:carbon storage regulator